MPANLSLILNLLLLVVVIVAIGHVMKTRRQSAIPGHYNPSLGLVVDNKGVNDEVIAVRKISTEPVDDLAEQTAFFQAHGEPSDTFFEDDSPGASSQQEASYASNGQTVAGQTLMLFLLAKEQRQFVGYELLQTLLAVGLRFGEGNLFHRHQLANGQGPVIFSLAAATSSGVFDLQNMGAFSARGLCVFMQTSGNASIDNERFGIFYETAKQLSEELDAHLLDDQRRPLTKENLSRYQRFLSSGASCELSAFV